MKTNLFTALTLTFFATLNPQLSTCFAQSTAFTYQGRLNAGGEPANGTYDLVFTIYDLPTGSGAFANQTNSAVAISNGLFTVTLDFGSGVFDGSERWLEVGVRSNGAAAAFVALSPRQPVTPTPYAIRAANASAVSDLSITAAKLSAGAGANGQVLKMSGSDLGWDADNNSGGTVTSVSAGTGLTGGPITTSGSLSIDTTVVPRLSAQNTFVNVQNIFPSLATRKGLVIRGAASQTANLEEWQNNAGTILASVSPGGIFNGNGAGLSGLDAANISVGTLDDARLSANVVFNGGNPTFNAVSLAQLDVAIQLTVGLNQTNVSTSACSILGGGGNAFGEFVNGSTIGGGGNNVVGASFSGILSGDFNAIQSNALRSSIVGGRFNSIGQNDLQGFVGGGQGNVIQAEVDDGVIAGGLGNLIGTNANFAVIAGGFLNVVSPNAEYATIPGGQENLAAKPYSFAAGRQAKADHLGAFVWADSSTSSDFHSTADNQFAVRAEGGVLLNTGAGGLTVNGSTFLNSELHCATLIGGIGNAANPFAVVAGGTSNTNDALGGFLGGGGLNLIQPNASSSVLVGGANNTIQSNAQSSFLGGGANNIIGTNSSQCVVAGGELNRIGNDATHDAIGGGFFNRIPQGSNSVIVGGFGNTVSGDYSFAAGRLATANHSGTFVWADPTSNTPFTSGGSNQFLIRASGGVGIGKTNPASALDVNGTVTALAFNPPSDRNLKENFVTISPREVLEKVAGLGISRWNFKADAGATHIGPMAQDFYAAFGTGNDDKHIATVDADGVALAAIQGLNQKLEETRTDSRMKDAEIAVLKQSIAELKQAIESLTAKK